MPSVPRYESAQVDPAPLRAPRATSVADGSDPAAQQQKQLGDALTRSAGAATNIVRDMQRREDADVIFRTETKVKDDYLTYEQEARKREGRFAKDLTSDTRKWWDDQVSKAGESLKSDEQRRVFAEKVTQLRHVSLNSMSHYESVQLEKSHDEAWTASKNTTISTAAATPTNEAVDAARLELERSNRYQAARRGWEPERLTAEILKDKTTLHKQVLQSLVLDDPMSAQKYFDKFKGEIDGTLHAELGKFSKEASAGALASLGVEEIWNKHGPKSDRDAVSLDKLEAAAREKFKDNEFAKKAALSDLKERTSAFMAGRKERDDSTEAAVWKQYNAGAPLSQIRRQPEFLQLSSETQRKVTEHIETQAHVRDARTEADKTRAGFAAYSVYSRPENLESMTENQILNLTPSLGNQLVGHLMDRKRSLGAKVVEARIDQQDFDHVAQAAGLKPFDPKKSEEERASLGELKYRIEQRIDGEQTKAKRQLTRAEKMTIFQQEMDNKIIVDRFDFGTGLRDSAQPAIITDEKELKNAYVLIDGKRVNLGSIPAEDRAAIIRARQARNLPVTEQLIAQTWLNAKTKKPVQKVAETDPAKSVPY